MAKSEQFIEFPGSAGVSLATVVAVGSTVVDGGGTVVEVGAGGVVPKVTDPSQPASSPERASCSAGVTVRLQRTLIRI